MFELDKENFGAFLSEQRNGIFRMNIPGLSFNNSNWPYIVKVGQIWTAITMITVPMINLLVIALSLNAVGSFVIQNLLLILYLAGLFVPIYIVGKKYG